MFEAVRLDPDSGEYRPCSFGTAELGCEAVYTKTAREVECPEVEIMYDGYSGTAAGYCETYTLNVSAALGSVSTAWLGADGAGQLTYSQCQAEPMNLKPGHQHACEQQRSLRIDGGLAWATTVSSTGADADSAGPSSGTPSLLVETQLQHEFSDTSSHIFIAAKECCSTDAEDKSACNARYADSIPVQATELEGGLGGLVITLLVVLACLLCCKCQGRAEGVGSRLSSAEKVSANGYEKVVQVDGKVTSTQKLRTGPGKFRPIASQCPKPLPEGTLVTINSVAPEMDTKGLPWLPVSVSIAGGEVVPGYLPQSAVELVETATPSSCCTRLCGGGATSTASEGEIDDAKSGPSKSQKEEITRMEIGTDQSIAIP